MMDYEWDEQKNAANIANHGVDFALMEGFDWRSPVVVPDNRFDYGETRFTAFSFIGDRLYVCVHTWREEKCRIISLRKANERERKIYNEKS